MDLDYGSWFQAQTSLTKMVYQVKSRSTSWKLVLLIQKDKYSGTEIIVFVCLQICRMDAHFSGREQFLFVSDEVSEAWCQ